MKAIFKYEIFNEYRVTIKMPKRAEILTVQSQKSIAVIWALVDTDNEDEERNFITVGTGQEFDPQNKRYTGTYQLWEGRIVYHVFEILE